MERQTQSKPGTTKRAKSRRWPWVIAAVLTLVLLVVILAPVYLSSDGFKQMIQTKIDRATGGTAAIGKLSVGWLKGVQISDFRFQDGAGWARVSISGIDAQPRLGALLGGALSLGETIIDKPSIEIDLRKRPAPVARPPGRTTGPPKETAGLALLSDLVVNDGTVRLTDTGGKTIQVANLDSRLSVRPPGQPSRIEVDMVVADAGDNAQIHASGTVTPAKSSGWTLKGTSGDVVVEVNDLKLGSLAAVFELAGVELQAKGRISADVKGTLKDGKMEAVTAKVTGRNLDITGAALKGDRLQTSRLEVNAELAQEGQAIRIEELKALTDWASLTASGTMPTSVKSMSDLLKTEASYDLQGEFDCNLPALLSQMPKTFALKENMQITAGRITGTASTTTQGGRAAIKVQTQVTGLAGNVDGKALMLSEPVVASLELSADEKKTQLDALNISAAFAKINASGDFEKIDYDGQIDLAKFQAELGKFADLGPYEMAGQARSKGQIAIQEKTMAVSGMASVTQLALASADGNSVAEPRADIDFALNLDREKQVLAIDHTNVTGSFGQLTLANGTIPLNEESTVPLKAVVTARDLDLKKAKPYAVLFAGMPKTIELAGIAQSQITITGQNKVYRFQSDATKIQNFKLAVPEEEPFEQEQVTLLFDAQIDPNAKTINVERFRLDSPEIRIEKGQFEKTRQGKTTRVSGAIEGEWDWAAVGQIASPFLPAGLDLAGRRPVSLNFASTYPTDDPNSLMANLDASSSASFESAHYKGLNVGPTAVEVQIEQGMMTITPFTTTVNNGQLNFAANANFKEKSRLLRTPEPMLLAQGIELNKEMTAQLLQYVNPLFANVTGISGIANFQCEKLAIPLAADSGVQAEVVGTFSASDVLVEASGLLDEILKASGENLRGQKLTVRPTRIAFQNGVVQYSNMQIDVGDNPITFGGRIGQDGKLDMTVTLPWTLRGRTARVGRDRDAGPRIDVSLTGTIDRPKLDLGRLLQDQVFKALEGLF